MGGDSSRGKHINHLAKLVGRDFNLTTQILDNEVHGNKLALDYRKNNDGITVSLLSCVGSFGKMCVRMHNEKQPRPNAPSEGAAHPEDIYI